MKNMYQYGGKTIALLYNRSNSSFITSNSIKTILRNDLIKLISGNNSIAIAKLKVG